MKSWHSLPCSDPDLSTLLGLDRTADFTDSEREAPDVLLRIPGDGREDADISLSTWVGRARQGEWHGRANSLGPLPRHHWTVIDEVAEAAHAEHPEIQGTLVAFHSTP